MDSVPKRGRWNCANDTKSSKLKQISQKRAAPCPNDGTLTLAAARGVATVLLKIGNRDTKTTWKVVQNEHKMRVGNVNMVKAVSKRVSLACIRPACMVCLNK